MEINKADIIKLAAEAGAKAALEAWEKQWKEKQREQKNMRLWNTRMLLRHYNSLKKYCENAVYDRQTAAVSESPVEILETLGNCSKETYIESIKSSVQRTRVIMTHVEAMLQIYKIFCDSSDRLEDKRRYRILTATYFDGIKIEDICIVEKIDRSTYYRDNRETTEMLSALIFGVDGLSAMRKR